MSAEIEQRVVEMRFDNKKFEKNAQTTINTLDRLDKSLDLKGSTDGFNALEKAAKSVDLSSISNSMDTITGKISFLGTIGDQVIRNFTTKFVNMSERFVRSLSFDQIQNGFDKYATKTESVQTIMNATGKDINEVSEVLSKLNTYTDETSYKFTDMVSSIGKFTSAGVDLQVAENAMEGIANWAAKAGVGPEKAAGAFYNMSQAIGSGALRLQDWKSIENLNMATKDVKEQFIEAGIAAGTLKKSADKVFTTVGNTEVTVENFNNSLSKGWINQEVILSTMEKYADTTQEFGLNAFKAAQEAKTFKDAIDAVKDAVSTGWMNIFEQLFGNYEEARVLWTEVANELIEAFTKPTEALNEIFTEWHDKGGYIAFVETLRYSWQSLKSIISEVGKVFSEVFPGISGAQLADITKQIRDITGAWAEATVHIDRSEFMLSPKELKALEDSGADLSNYYEQLDNIDAHNKKVDENLRPLRDTMQGVFSVLRAIKTVTGNLFKIVLPFTALIKPIGKLFLTISSALGRLIAKIADTITHSKLLAYLTSTIERLVAGIVHVISLVVDNFSEFIDLLSRSPAIQKFASAISSVYEYVKGLAAPYLDKASKYIESFISALEEMDEEKLAKFVSSAAEKLMEIAESLAPYWEKFKAFVSKAYSFLAKQFSKISDFYNNVVVPSGVIKTARTYLGLLVEKIKELGGSFIKYIKEGGWRGALEWLREKIADIFEVIKGFSLTNFLKDALSVTKIGGIAAAIIALYNATKTMKKVSKFFTSFPKALKSFSKGLLIKRIAVSVLLLAAAMWVLSRIPAERFKEIAISVGIMMAALAGIAIIIGVVSGLLSKTGVLDSRAMGKMSRTMLVISIAMVVLAVAMNKLAAVPADRLWDCVWAMGALIVILSAAAVGLSFVSKGVTTLGVGLLAMAVAVLLFIYSFDLIQKRLEEFKNKDSAESMKTSASVLIGIAAGLLAMTIILSLALKKVSTSLYGVAAVIAAIGVSIFLISAAVKSLSKASPEDLLKGAIALVAIVVVLGFITAIAALLKETSWKAIIGIAAALVALGVSMLLLTAAIKILGKMDDDTALNGIIRLGVILLAISVVMGVVGYFKPDGGAFKGLALMLIAIVAAVWILGSLPGDKLLKGVATLTAVFVAIEYMLLIGQNALKGANFGTFAGLALVIGIVAGAIWLLANFTNPEEAIASALAMGAVFIALGFALLMGQNAMKNANPLALLTMAALVGAVGGALALATINDGALSAALGISMVMVVLALVFREFDKVASTLSWGDIAKTAVMMVAVLAPITGALAALMSMPDTSNILSIATGLSEVLLAMALVTFILSKIGGGGAASIGYAAIGAVALGAVIAILGAAIVGIAELADWLSGKGYDVLGKIQKGGEIIGAIGEAVGNFFGGIISRASSGLPAAADNISQFIEKISGALEKFSAIEVDSSKADALGAVAGAILKLTAAELLDGISRFLLGDTNFEEFATNIGGMGKSLNTFAANVEDIDDDKVEKIKKATDAIGAIADVAKKMPRQGGWLQNVIGTPKTLEEFATELKGSIPGIKEFANEAPQLSGKSEQVKKVAKMIDALAEVAGHLKPQTTDVLWGAYHSEAQSLHDFMEQFVDTEDAVAKASGGAPKVKKGIGTMVSELADSIGEVSDEDFENIGRMSTIISALAEVAATLTDETTSVLWGMVKTDTTTGLGNFLSELVTIGPKFSELGSAFDDTSLGNLTKLSSIIKRLSEASVLLAEEGNNSWPLEYLGNTLDKISETFNTAATKMDGINYDALDKFLAWIETNKTTLDSISDVGKASIEAYLSGLADEIELKSSSAASQTSSKVAEKISSYSYKFRRAGIEAVLGFIGGIESKLTLAAAAGSNLGEETVRALRKALRIESPSKVMRRIGDYAGEGYVDGLESWADKASTTGDNLGESVINSAASVLDYINDLLDGKLTVDMTIRPVFDLDAFDTGISTIDGRLSQSGILTTDIDDSGLNQSSEVAQLVDISWRILRAIQNGSDLYLDDKVLAGRINRRLG